MRKNGEIENVSIIGYNRERKLINEAFAEPNLGSARIFMRPIRKGGHSVSNREVHRKQFRREQLL